MGNVTIIGTSIVNHNARAKLKLSVTKYVMLQYFVELFEEGKHSSDYVAMQRLGVKGETVEDWKKELINEGYLIENPSTTIPMPYKEWGKVHKEKPEEFAAFYAPMEIEGVTVSWRNQNPGAIKKKFSTAIKASPFALILYSKILYFVSKYQSNSLDFVMGAEKFVGPDKHYLTKWTLDNTGRRLAYDYARKHYWTGNMIDLSGMFVSEHQTATTEAVRITPKDMFQ